MLKFISDTPFLENRTLASKGIVCTYFRIDTSLEFTMDSTLPFMMLSLNKGIFSAFKKKEKFEILTEHVFLGMPGNRISIECISPYSSFGCFEISPSAFKQCENSCRDLNNNELQSLFKSNTKITLNTWLRECLFRLLFEHTTDHYRIRGLIPILEVEIVKELFFIMAQKQKRHPKDEFFPSQERLNEFPESLKRAILYVEKTPIDQVNVTQIAKASGASPSSLQRMFHKFYNKSPSDFINKRKMIFAKELLLMQRHSINEIAEVLGYSCASAFIFAFKKDFGDTPQKFRQRI